MTDHNTTPMHDDTSLAQSIKMWIAQSLDGDQDAYQHLYIQFADGVYRLCYSLLALPQDAEDVVQESFVYAFKNLHRYDASKASFKTWLYTIAVSRCRNVYRHKRLPTIDISSLLGWSIAAPNSETPEAVAALTDARHAIRKALMSLSSSMREAIVLRYGHGLTYREIADVMGCPQKTAESRVRLAHQKLRQNLEAVGPGLLEELLRI